MASAETAQRLQKPIRDWLRAHKSQAVDELADWVREPSLPGHEAPLQRKIEAKLRSLGFATELYHMGTPEDQLASDPFFISPRTDFSQSPNVIARKSPLDNPRGENEQFQKRSLLLNGHVDVVPVGDEATWTEDPFGGRYDPKTDRLYGRGASDMKGGVYAMILAVEAVQAVGGELLGALTVATVVEEESGGAGTLSTIRRGVRADACIIPEPSGKRIFPVQQGSVWFRIRVPGRGAHGGTRYAGISAIEHAVEIVAALRDLEETRNAPLRASESLYRGVPIPVPINVGRIEGGRWPSSVPDNVVLEGRLGVRPGERYQDAQAELSRAVAAVAERPHFQQVGALPAVEFFGARWLPGAVDRAHPVVGLLEAHAARVSEAPLAVEASPWGTDGGLLTALADTPSVVYGPGPTSLAHYPDEHVVVEDVLECAEVLAGVLMGYLGVRSVR